MTDGSAAATGTVAGLEERQVALVAALVAGGPLPEGFDPDAVGAAAQALLRKRASEVARAWPMLAAALGDAWPARFVRWAQGRTPRGSLLDGWAFATELLGSDDAEPAPKRAAVRRELAGVQVVWALRDGAAVRRRGPAIRLAPGMVVLQLFGRVHCIGRTARI